MVNSGHSEIGWSDDGTTIVVTNPERLSTSVLPQYFRHQQYASWVRALNAYDFKKTGPNRWSHPNFCRDSQELLPLIRRKPTRKSGSGRSDASSDPSAASSSGASTSLIPSPAGAISAPEVTTALRQVLLDARQQLWWLESREVSLQQELHQIQQEDFQQRFDAVRIMQAFLAKITRDSEGVPIVDVVAAAADAAPSPPQPSIIFNPAVITPPAGASQAPLGGATPGMAQPQLHGPTPAAANGGAAAGSTTATGASAVPTPTAASSAGDSHGVGGQCGGPLPPAAFALPPAPPEVAEVRTADSPRLSSPEGVPALPSVGASKGVSSFDSPAGYLPSRVPSVAGSIAGSEVSRVDIGELADLIGGLDSFPPSRVPSMGGSFSPGFSSGTAAGMAAGVAGTMGMAGHPMGKLPPSPPLAGMPPLAPMPHAQVQPAAPAIAPADAPPLGASLLHFASVLARLPRLPESTAALPAKGTVQREHLESAIDWCFQQIQRL